ncbi:MAG: Coenzyme A biosynthesis bifunctional protein CoaBC [Anaerolineales bacterium]|nr:Coenzyme A biosynthesis bifunctional protein CoaBC [Anaerolineales bacterium]
MSIRVLCKQTIVLGVTGSIAAYKAVEIASRLVKAGAHVDVIMTEAATQLVAPLTFQAITHRPVTTDLFDPRGELGIDHVALAKRADLMAIAPITANTLAKLAQGLADNALTTTFLAVESPVIVAPAMESHMWLHPSTQRNLDTLQAWGTTVVEPESGHLASGAEGVGRLAEPVSIVDTIRFVLGRDGPLAGRHVAVTAGPTREAIDPVRYISNHSSGRMGYAVAEAVRDLGARVTLVSGPTALRAPAGVEFVAVTSTHEMRDAVLDVLPDVDAVVGAAAVTDYGPAVSSEQKIKKAEGGFSLELVHNPDILMDVKAWKEARERTHPIIIGFAAETENLIENAQNKLVRKRMDLIVANLVPATFGSDRSQATLIQVDQPVERLPSLTKTELADKLADRLVYLL